jgi:diguanylate cyclase (GGDEF)-like protein
VRVTIIPKILAGYAAAAVFFSASAFFAQTALRRADADAVAVAGLEALQTLQHLQVDLAVMEVSGQQHLAQATAGALEIFHSRREDFDRELERLSRLDPGDPELRQISDEYRRFLDLFAEETRPGPGTSDGSPGRPRLALMARRLGSSLDALASRARAGVEEHAGANRRALTAVFYLSLAGLLLGLAPPLLVALNIHVTIRKLRQAVQLIAEGAFDHDPQIRAADELGELARGLQAMAQRFKNYEQLCLDASPLTRLPGNIAIERALLERIRRGEKFALCYADLDDFKAFNDTYGYAKGSEVIKVAGEIINEARRRFGRAEDFVGHIGGDDFVMITAPENVTNVCENIIEEFDRVIPYFYTPEDRERGFIEAADRYGVTRQFPLMTISIAVVSDASREIVSPSEIAQVAAEIKEFVKTLPGSNYLIDRRRGTRSPGPRPERR